MTPHRPHHRRRRVHRLEPRPAARRRAATGSGSSTTCRSASRRTSTAFRTSSCAARWPTRDAVRAAVAGVDAVVHLAARAGIADSVARPARDVRGQRRLVARAARRGPAGRRPAVRVRLVERRRRRPRAAEPTRPTCPTRSRRTAPRSSPIEAYCQAYAATYGLAACALRFSNAYGPYSLHKRSVVAAWLRAALGGRADRDPRRRRADPRLRLRRRPGGGRRGRPRRTRGRRRRRAVPGRDRAWRRRSTSWPTTIGRAVGRPLEIRPRAGRGPATSGGTSAASTRRRAVLGYRAAVAPRRGLARHGALVRGRPRGPGAGRRRRRTPRRARSERSRPMTASRPTPSPLRRPRRRRCAAAGRRRSCATR